MKYQKIDKSGSDLLLLSKAAEVLHMSRNTFNRHAKLELIPPWAFEKPRRRWLRPQLERHRNGFVRPNEDGIWYELDQDTGRWRRLPNQYVNDLPKDPV